MPLQTQSNIWQLRIVHTQLYLTPNGTLEEILSGFTPSSLTYQPLNAAYWKSATLKSYHFSLSAEVLIKTIEPGSLNLTLQYSSQIWLQHPAPSAPSSCILRKLPMGDSELCLLGFTRTDSD